VGSVDTPGWAYGVAVADSYAYVTDGHSGLQIVQLCPSDQTLPTISLDPTSLENSCPEGEDAPDQSFDVWNSGTGTLSYSISDDVDWLGCVPTGGTSTGEHDSITVNYTTSGLSADTYSVLGHDHDQ